MCFQNWVIHLSRSLFIVRTKSEPCNVEDLINTNVSFTDEQGVEVYLGAWANSFLASMKSLHADSNDQDNLEQLHSRTKDSPGLMSLLTNKVSRNNFC